MEQSQAQEQEKHSKSSWLSAPFYEFGHVCKMDGAHTEGVDGGAVAPRRGQRNHATNRSVMERHRAYAPVEVLRFRERIRYSIYETEH